MRIRQGESLEHGDKGIVVLVSRWLERIHLDEAGENLEVQHPVIVMDHRLEFDGNEEWRIHAAAGRGVILAGGLASGCA